MQENASKCKIVTRDFLSARGESEWERSEQLGVTFRRIEFYIDGPWVQCHAAGSAGTCCKCQTGPGDSEGQDLFCPA